ncbi:MAG TPA: RpiB/LacA/LacB family sugar-phosphate isomerase [Candidatus Paceibacterota bacterium]
MATKSAQQNIILAADHAGFALKEAIKGHLLKRGYQVTDVGAHEFRADDDYPVYMTMAAMKVAADLSGDTKAIIFGGSGEGEAIVANRFPGVRALVWYGGSKEILKLSRQHNNANTLSLGARFVDEKTAVEAVDLWLATPFSNEERHVRRIHEIDNIE